MKKTFSLVHPKIKVARLIDAIKFEIKKYIKRERAKALPEGVDFWDFDCRFGADEASSKTIHLSAIGEAIDGAETKEFESFYLEILSKPGKRTKKPTTNLNPKLTKPQSYNKKHGSPEAETE